MPRSGYEPMQARSALRLRLTFALLGVVWGVGAAVGFALADLPGWAGLCAFVALVAVGDVFVVRYRMRQGDRYQPGRDEPPNPPFDPDEQPDPPVEARHSHGATRR